MKEEIKRSSRCVTGAYWTEVMKENIKKYEFSKIVNLNIEECDEKEKDILEKIKISMDSENIKNCKEFEQILAENKIFGYDEEIEFAIQKIDYQMEDNSFLIYECDILFLSHTKNDFTKFLEEFTNQENVDKIEMKFSKVKRHEELREKCKNTVKGFLNEEFVYSPSKTELINFFNGKKVIYNEEIDIDDVRVLRTAGRSKNSLAIPTVNGNLITFISSQVIPLEQVNQVIKDVNVFIGAHSNTNHLYAMKIDENYKNPKLNVVLVN